MMRRLVVGLVFVLWTSFAVAQAPVQPGQQVCKTDSGITTCSWQPTSAINPLPVTSAGGSISGGWLQSTVGTPLTPSGSSVSESVTGSSTITEVLLTNVGSNGAYCGVVATATTSYQYIAPSGGWFPFQIASGSNTVACTSASATTVNVQTGSGLATGTGGGGGGGSVPNPIGTTAAANSYAPGWSADIGDCATASPWSGTGTPSLCSLLWGIYNSSTSSYNWQSAPTAIAVTATTSYVAGNSFGALQTIAVFRTTTQPSLLLTQFTELLTPTYSTEPTLLFYLFTKNPTSSGCATDNSSFSLNSADAPYLVPGSPFSITPVVPTAGGNNAALGQAPAGVLPVSIKNADASPTQDIYVCEVAATTFTSASGTVGPVLTLGGIQD